jgi:hypothetical protein
MCPVCMASAGLAVGSVVSGGSVTALVVRILGKKKKEINSKAKQVP